jgi:hypothetical protein
MAKKRQFCDKCNQITTQTRSSAKAEWTCLCCESARNRSAQQTEQIRAKNSKKPRLNIKF